MLLLSSIHTIVQIPNQIISKRVVYVLNVEWYTTLPSLFCQLYFFCPPSYPSTCYPNTSAKPNKRSKLLQLPIPTHEKGGKNRFCLMIMSSQRCMFFPNKRRTASEKQQPLRKSKSDNTQTRLHLQDACLVSSLSSFSCPWLLSPHVFICWANTWIFVKSNGHRRTLQLGIFLKWLFTLNDKRAL